MKFRIYLVLIFASLSTFSIAQAAKIDPVNMNLETAKYLNSLQTIGGSLDGLENSVVIQIEGGIAI